MAESDLAPEGQDNQDERPEWLPENFKKPEDLLNSYKESQRKITELSTQNKGLEESIGTLSAQFEQFTATQSKPAYDPNQDPYVVAYEQAMEQGDYRAAMAISDQRSAAIAQQTAEQVAQQHQEQTQYGRLNPDDLARLADNELQARYGEEWAAYKGRVVELVGEDQLFTNNPNLWSSLATTTQALDRAYQMVKAEDVLSGNDVVQQQLADTRSMKLAAQSAAGASGRTDPVSDAKAEWEAIKNSAPQPYWERRS